MLAMTYQASFFDKFVIAGATAVLFKGLIELIGKVQVTYGMRSIAFAPLAVLTIIPSCYLIMKLFPPEKQTLEGGEEYCRAQLAAMGRISAGVFKAI